MTEISLTDKVVALQRAFDSAGIRHAFGGALALAYYAEPRATIDIDVNVFIGIEEHGVVDRELVGLGIDAPADPDALARDGWFRYRWERNPVDVFYAYQDLHQAMEEGRRSVPFGDDRITILSPEHLMVCKALFDRPKDWIDIEQIIVGVPDLDGTEVVGWMREYVPEGDTRLERISGLLGL